jgi:hypothetical protein
VGCRDFSGVRLLRDQRADNLVGSREPGFGGPRFLRGDTGYPASDRLSVTHDSWVADDPLVPVGRSRPRHGADIGCMRSGCGRDGIESGIECGGYDGE